MNSEQIKLIDGFPFIKFTQEIYSEEEMLFRSKVFYEWMNKRRSVRDFSDKPISKEVIETSYSLHPLLLRALTNSHGHFVW